MKRRPFLLPLLSLFLFSCAESEGYSSSILASSEESSLSEETSSDIVSSSSLEANQIEEHTHTFSEQWSYGASGHWHEPTCGDITAVKDYAKHTFGDYSVVSEPSEGSDGIKEASCTVCGYAKQVTFHGYAEAYSYDRSYHWHGTICGHDQEEDVLSKEAHSFSWATLEDGSLEGACSVCGYVRNDDPTCDEDGQTLTLGTYPQSRVEDEVLLSSLNESTPSLPSSEDPGSWSSLPLYKDGEKGSVGFYYDLTLEGEDYRAVYLLDYPDIRVYGSNSSDGQWAEYQRGDYLRIGLSYFKFDPIEWTVRAGVDNSHVVVADKILDVSPFSSKSESWSVDGVMVYPNNYAYSDIRTFLLGSFYKTAFDEVDQAKIPTSTISLNASESFYGDSNPYGGGELSDPVFLLSYKEALTAMPSEGERIKYPTPYALAMGCYSTFGSLKNGGLYWLRTPNGENPLKADRVHDNGHFTEMDRLFDVDYCNYGLVPAFKTGHSHVYTEYEYDETSHWRYSICEGEEAVLEKSAHLFTEWAFDLTDSVAINPNKALHRLPL